MGGNPGNLALRLIWPAGSATAWGVNDLAVDSSLPYICEIPEDPALRCPPGTWADGDRCLTAQANSANLANLQVHSNEHWSSNTKGVCATSNPLTQIASVTHLHKSHLCWMRQGLDIDSADTPVSTGFVQDGVTSGATSAGVHLSGRSKFKVAALLPVSAAVDLNDGFNVGRAVVMTPDSGGGGPTSAPPLLDAGALLTVADRLTVPKTVLCEQPVAGSAAPLMCPHGFLGLAGSCWADPTVPTAQLPSWSSLARMCHTRGGELLAPANQAETNAVNEQICGCVQHSPTIGIPSFFCANGAATTTAQPRYCWIGGVDFNGLLPQPTAHRWKLLDSTAQFPGASFHTASVGVGDEAMAMILNQPFSTLERFVWGGIELQADVGAVCGLRHGYRKCAPGWFLVQGKCYKRFQALATRAEAALTCSAEGGTLWSPLQASEAILVGKVLGPSSGFEYWWTSGVCLNGLPGCSWLLPGGPQFLALGGEQPQSDFLSFGGGAGECMAAKVQPANPPELWRLYRRGCNSEPSHTVCEVEADASAHTCPTGADFVSGRCVWLPSDSGADRLRSSQSAWTWVDGAAECGFQGGTLASLADGNTHAWLAQSPGALAAGQWVHLRHYHQSTPFPSDAWVWGGFGTSPQLVVSSQHRPWFVAPGDIGTSSTASPVTTDISCGLAVGDDALMERAACSTSHQVMCERPPRRLCPVDWFAADEMCYKVLPGATNFPAADLACRLAVQAEPDTLLRLDGTSLASWTSEESILAIRSYALTKHGGAALWVGAQYSSVEGVLWFDRAPGYTPWCSFSGNPAIYAPSTSDYGLLWNAGHVCPRHTGSACAALDTTGGLFWTDCLSLLPKPLCMAAPKPAPMQPWLVPPLPSTTSTATPSPTRTPSTTRSATGTPTGSQSPSPTQSMSGTVTPSASGSGSATSMSTATNTASPTVTPSSTRSATASPFETAEPTLSPTPTASATPTPSTPVCAPLHAPAGGRWSCSSATLHDGTVCSAACESGMLLLGLGRLRCMTGAEWRWADAGAAPLSAAADLLHKFPFAPSCVFVPGAQVAALGYTSSCGSSLRFEWKLQAAPSIDMPFGWAELAAAWPWVSPQPLAPLPPGMAVLPCRERSSGTCQAIAQADLFNDCQIEVETLLEDQWARISAAARGGVSWVLASVMSSAGLDSPQAHVTSVAWGSTADRITAIGQISEPVIALQTSLPGLDTAVPRSATELPTGSNVTVTMRGGSSAASSVSTSALDPALLQTWTCETSALRPALAFVGPDSQPGRFRPVLGMSAVQRQLSTLEQGSLVDPPLELTHAAALQQPKQPSVASPLLLALAATPDGLTLPLQTAATPSSLECTTASLRGVRVETEPGSISLHLPASQSARLAAESDRLACTVGFGGASINHSIAIDIANVPSTIPVFADVLVQVPGQSTWSSSWPSSNPAWSSAVYRGGGATDPFSEIASAARVSTVTATTDTPDASVVQVFTPVAPGSFPASSAAFRRPLSPGLQIAVVADRAHRASSAGRPGTITQVAAFAPGMRAWLGQVPVPVTAVSLDGQVALLRIPDSTKLCNATACASNDEMRLWLANPSAVPSSWVSAAEAAAAAAVSGQQPGWVAAEDAAWQVTATQWLQDQAPWTLDVSTHVLGGASTCPGACPGSHPLAGGQLGFTLTQACVGYPLPGPVCYEPNTRAQCAFGAGLDCVPCGEGAVCPGGFLRFPVAGFWASASDSRQAAQACAAPATERCLGWSASDGRSVCGAEYLQGSRRCGECAAGHFPSDSGACLACPAADSISAVLVPLAIFAGSLLIVFILMFGAVYIVMVVRGGSIWGGLQRSSTFVVWMVTMMQVVVQVGKTTAPGLPSYLVDFYNRLNVLQFDSKGVLHPSCYTSSPVSTSLIPLLIALGLMATLIALFAVWRDLRKPAPKCSACSTRWIGLALRGVFSASTLLFAMVCNTALDAVHCESDVDSGQQFWAAHPSVVCWEGEHTALGAVAVVVLVVYVLGYPLLTYLWVARALHVEMMSSDNKAVYAAVQARASRAYNGLVRIGSSSRSGWDSSDSDGEDVRNIELVPLGKGANGVDAAQPESISTAQRNLALRAQELQQGGMRQHEAKLAAAGVASYAQVLSAGAGHSSMDAVRSRTQAARLLAQAPVASTASSASPLASILQVKRSVPTSGPGQGKATLQAISSARSNRALLNSSKSARHILPGAPGRPDAAAPAAGGAAWCPLLGTPLGNAARSSPPKQRRDTAGRLARSLDVHNNPLQQVSKAPGARSTSKASGAPAGGTGDRAKEPRPVTADSKCASCIGPAMAWHCREASRKCRAGRSKVQFQCQPARAQQSLHALLDSSPSLQENQALIHFTYNDFRVSMFYFRQLDLLLLALLSVLLTFWAAPASARSAAGRAAVTVLLLLGMVGILAMHPRFRYDESWKGPVKVYSLLLAAAASVLNAVMWSLAREAEAAAADTAKSPAEVDPSAETPQEQEVSAGATASVLAQLIFAASIGLFVLLFVAFWYVLLSGAAAEDDSTELTHRVAQAARIKNAAVPRDFEVTYDRQGNPLIAKPAELKVQRAASTSQRLRGFVAGLFSTDQHESSSASGSRFRPTAAYTPARSGAKRAAGLTRAKGSVRRITRHTDL